MLKAFLKAKEREKLASNLFAVSPILLTTLSLVGQEFPQKGNFGIVIHSASEMVSSWHEVEDKKNNAEIIWTTMSPRSEEKSGEGLNGIIDLILLRI